MKLKTVQNQDRRKLIKAVGITGVVAGSVPSNWVAPLIDSVVLPAHAQMSVCVTDSQFGGPLIGHPSGAANCQAACEAEAVTQNAQLCAVTETVDAGGDTQCGCDLDQS